jgi:hypothetical protein
MQAYRHPMQSRVFYVACTSIEDIKTIFPAQPLNVFTMIVTRATHISAEDCATLVHFCTQFLKIPHSTLVRISAGRNKGDLALAFNHKNFSLGILCPLDKAANMVYLLPHLLDTTASHKWPRLTGASKRTKLRCFHLLFNPASHKNVKSYHLSCNTSIEYHEWCSRTFTSRLEIVQYKSLNRVVRPITPIDVTLDDILPLWKYLKEVPVVWLAWEWMLTKA